MSDETLKHGDDEMRDEYDFSQPGVVGKYYSSHGVQGTTVILDADVLREFPDSKAVNEALRRVIRGRRRRRNSEVAQKQAR